MDHLLDVRKMSMKVPGSKQQVFMLGSSCSFYNDGTVKVFDKDIEYLISKMLFACQHQGLVGSIKPGAGKEGMFLATPRPVWQSLKLKN